MVRAYFSQKVSILYIQFLYKAELLFDESLCSVRYWARVSNLKFFLWVLSADQN